MLLGSTKKGKGKKIKAETEALSIANTQRGGS